MKNERLYLEDILQAIDRILKRTAGLTQLTFGADEDAQDVAIRHLAIIGEASNRLSNGLKNRHSEIAWRDIIAMRNFIVHEYEGVKRDIVWDTVMNDLIPLRKAVEAMLKEIDAQQ